MKACRLAMLGLMLGLVGCQDAGLGELERQLSDLRDKPQGHIEALPETPTYQAAVYDQAGTRSPFEPEKIQPRVAQAPVQDELAPDLTRPREPLERYALESLSLVGILTVGGRPSALVRAPDGQVHRLFEGAYLGTDFGRIREIHGTAIDIVEVVQDGQNGWTERQRTLALNEQDERAG
ncbi:type 4a pilus biogenesis lipoprotein PilP [Halomonas shantousis]